MADTLACGSLLAGRYQIVRTIHRGGMSVVYLAEDGVQQRQVAIKELRLPEGAGSEEAHEAEAWFARESYLLSSLRHALIPHFYSVFREAGRSYLVQEYVQGENLEEMVSRHGPLDPRAVADWGQALCDLLSYLHQQPEPVVFRDLKPANILLRPSGQLAVVDFGIARLYRPEQVGTVIGSPGYAPPEQYQGMASPQSDVYALGATMHRLLTGYDPEQGAPFTFPDARTLNPRVSAELAAVIGRAVQLAPEERFPTALAMGRALHATTSRSTADGGWHGARPLPDPHWAQQVFSFVFSVLVIFMLGLWIIHAVQPSAPPQPSSWFGPANGGTELLITTSPSDPGIQAPSVPRADPWGSMGRHWRAVGGADSGRQAQPYDGWYGR